MLVSLYDSRITMNDSLLDNTNIKVFFEVLFKFFVTLTKMIGNKLNNILAIGIGKTQRITGKSYKLLILWCQLLFLV